MMGLTERQSDCLRFVRARRAAGMPAPSYSEISRHLGVNRSSVHRLVHALIERGYLRFLPNRARSIALVDQREKAEQPSAAMPSLIDIVDKLDGDSLDAICEVIGAPKLYNDGKSAMRAWFLTRLRALADAPRPQG